MAGLDIQSQEAYDMASTGLLRPPYGSDGTNTVVYSIKSVEWSPPNLTLGNNLHHCHRSTCYGVVSLGPYTVFRANPGN